MVETYYDLSQKVFRLMNSDGITYMEALAVIKTYYEIQLMKKELSK